MEMSQTAARLLGLLSLLMVPRTWSGRELADRLGVSPRTVRNDIGALRDIGYTIDGTRGNEGGYRLSPYGSAVPPLLFDSDEAVAVAVGLRSGLSCIIGGMEETSARALAKLENILPSAPGCTTSRTSPFPSPETSRCRSSIPNSSSSSSTTVTVRNGCASSTAARTPPIRTAPTPAVRTAPTPAAGPAPRRRGAPRAF